jgi:hypothetical protein
MNQIQQEAIYRLEMKRRLVKEKGIQRETMRNFSIENLESLI